jgi:hypothetical protein
MVQRLNGNEYTPLPTVHEQLAFKLFDYTLQF